MTFRNQVNKLKENWLIIVLVVVALLFSTGGNSGYGVMNQMMDYAYDSFDGGMMEKSMVASSRGMGGYAPSYEQDFAPEVEERIKTRSASMSTEVERGEFYNAESKLKSILDMSDAYLLDENLNSYGRTNFKYLNGYYRIKVDSSKYSSVVTQLKEIGEIQSFNENTDDITGQYTNLELNLETEKNRLERYNDLYEETKDAEYKVELIDRIFNQERTIKYLEDRLKNMDTRVDYSTISFSLKEKQSEWGNIIFVKFPDLVRDFVRSVNNLLQLFFVIIPWLAVGWIVYIIYKKRR